MDQLRDKCGIFGIYDNNDSLDVSRMIYLSLYALQHRGQESCGISVANGQVIHSYRNTGLVHDVFNNNILSKLKGRIGIGHVRYSTTGASTQENAQPIIVDYRDGSMALAHNGNLINAGVLRQQMGAEGSVFITGSDTELFLKIICKNLVNSENIQEAITKTMRIIKGSYAVVLLMQGKLIAFRDPCGIRPLCIGIVKNSYMVSSESCAFPVLGGKLLREVKPGEIIVIDEKGIHSYATTKENNSSLCVFEFVYFARPDSYMGNTSIHQSRIEAGKRLAIEHPVEADLVIGVPDSALSAALGYARQSGIQFGHGLIRNRYVGRTFIQPTQELREAAVRIKFSSLANEVEGKRIVMVDDSIVRGTTTRIIVNILKEAGAKEVHLRISSPPVKFPCYYGIDIATTSQLIASKFSADEICRLVGADSLSYLSIEGLLSTLIKSTCGLCSACFTGDYCVQ
ncbi:MAG: amidophosphoribosyltransferase [Bacillota bacterium]|jgi:amidophosphoribosyltransferase